MHRRLLSRVRALSCAGLAVLCAALPTQGQAQVAAGELPAVVRQALERAGVAPSQLSVWVGEVGAQGGAFAAPRLAWQDGQRMHPASVMKLVTSAAALHQLGVAYQWHTRVYLDGPLDHGVLRGALVIEGQGDPRLTLERVWLLLQRVRQLGVLEIRGDIVLDRSAYAVSAQDPGAFDGEPSKPYNVQPDALQLNQKSVMLSLRPDAAAGVARLSMEPALAGVGLTPQLPLNRKACGDWRAALTLDLSRPDRIRLAGAYPAACGERAWPLAYQEPARYDARLIEALWREQGGRLTGAVRDGAVPDGAVPALDLASPPLPEVLRDMNKFSNNMIAQQVLLALSPVLPARFETARPVVQDWLTRQVGCAPDELVLDNGSGLTRQERITARCLGRLMQWAWLQPWMPEWLATLPVAGVDGTARRAVAATGRAHFKTGSLADVAALAGYVHLPNGRRVALVAIVNQPQAGSSSEVRTALDGVTRWVLEDKELNTP